MRLVANGSNTCMHCQSNYKNCTTKNLLHLHDSRQLLKEKKSHNKTSVVKMGQKIHSHTQPYPHILASIIPSASAGYDLKRKTTSDIHVYIHHFIYTNNTQHVAWIRNFFL